jgi:DNA polymerase-3 subunit epsilon
VAIRLKRSKWSCPPDSRNSVRDPPLYSREGGAREELPRLNGPEPEIRGKTIAPKPLRVSTRDKHRIMREVPPMNVDEDLEAMASKLEASGHYRVLRKLDLKPFENAAPGARRGLFIDLETTGLSSKEHEIIELAMVPFAYTQDGEITAIGDPIQRLRQPSTPIPAKITTLTGLTDADVEGHSIDPAEVAAIIAPAAIVISHNAGFDRPFAEKAWPHFAVKPWGCSMSDIPWAEEGFEGLKLSYLAMASGVFFDGHRAANDCLAALHLLRLRLPSGATGLGRLLRSARAPTWRIWAENAPFEQKDKLKARNYRWNDGGDGRPRCWWIDVTDGELDAELDHLRSEVYGAEVELRPQRLTAFERYSSRA